MVFKAIVLALMFGYVAWRLSFSLRSVRARRDGDGSRADRLSAQGMQFGLGSGLLMVFVFIVAIVVIAH